MQRLDLDSGTTTPVLTPPESVGDWDTADEAIDVCPDCAVAHIPRRIVCCVDGTWMEPDGMAGFLADSFRGNASNVFRIWCSVKEGVVKDADGKSWQQVTSPFCCVAPFWFGVPLLLTRPADSQVLEGAGS